MKRIFTRLLLSAVMMMCCTVMNAQTTFEVGGIKYSVTGENTVEVVKKDSKYTYTGDVVIPATVTNPDGGKTYNVTGIGSEAFLNCSDLNTITIPESVTCIKNYAFQGCTSLTSLTIPEKVTSIGTNAFLDTGLASIMVAEKNTVYESPNNCNAIIEKSTHTLLAGCKNTVIPNTVTRINTDAFRWLRGLTSITIPESVTSIGDGAFWSTGLTSVVIGKSVETIGKNAFRNCLDMTEIYVLATTPPTLGTDAFDLVATDIPVYVPDVETYTGWGGFTNMRPIPDVTQAKEDAIGAINAAIEGVTDENILAVANQAKKDIVAAVTEYSINSIKTLALAKIDVIVAINAAIVGVTDEDILAVANQAKKDINNQISLASINSIKTLALDRIEAMKYAMNAIGAINAAIVGVTDEYILTVANQAITDINNQISVASINSIKTLALAKIGAIRAINAAIVGVTDEDILAVANQAKKDIVAAAPKDYDSIRTQALYRKGAMKDAMDTIDAAIVGVTDEDILAVANQAKKDIVAAATEDIRSIKEQALADLAIPLKYYNSGRNDAFGDMGTPLTDCPAVKVTKGDKEIILYAPDAVEMIKIPANK